MDCENKIALPSSDGYLFHSHLVPESIKVWWWLKYRESQSKCFPIFGTWKESGFSRKSEIGSNLRKKIPDGILIFFDDMAPRVLIERHLIVNAREAASW